jgi:hypothetical protein
MSNSFRKRVDPAPAWTWFHPTLHHHMSRSARLGRSLPYTSAVPPDLSDRLALTFTDISLLSPVTDFDLEDGPHSLTSKLDCLT